MRRILDTTNQLIFDEIERIKMDNLNPPTKSSLFSTEKPFTDEQQVPRKSLFDDTDLNSINTFSSTDAKKSSLPTSNIFEDQLVSGESKLVSYEQGLDAEKQKINDSLIIAREDSLRRLREGNPFDTDIEDQDPIGRSI
jgi:hypothetical protein